MGVEEKTVTEVMGRTSYTIPIDATFSQIVDAFWGGKGFSLNCDCS